VGSGRGGRAARVFRCPLGRITPIRCRGCDPPPALGTTLDARWTDMLRTRIGLRSPRPGPRFMRPGEYRRGHTRCCARHMRWAPGPMRRVPCRIPDADFGESTFFSHALR
jgi:hypothetical protein